MTKTRTRRTARTAQSGFSLVEITVVLAIVSGLLIICYSMIEQTVRATMFNESHNDLAIMTQRAVNLMQMEIVQSRAVFQEDAFGQAYRTALQIPAAVPRWPNTLLPMLQIDPTMAPDTGTGTDRFTGNSLLVVRQLEPLSVLYDDDGNAGTPQVEFLADRYRFEYFFLSPSAARSFSTSGFTLDLLQSTSVDFADYFQLSSLTTAQIQKIVPKIIAAGTATAWNPGQPIATAFYALSGATDGTFNAPLRNATIAIVSTTTLFPGLRGGRISGRMDYSLAFVPALPLNPYPLRMPIAVYAQPDASIPRFPAGFEVKVTGPAGSRKVMTRVLLMARYGVSTYEAQQGFVTTSASF
jgi:prepilin-type N-terminal cleavage/methylation domain-containing protein